MGFLVVLALETLAERSAVAAIKHQQFPSRPGLLHRLVEKRRSHSRGAEKSGLRIRHSQIQAPRVILQPVPREVEKKKVIAVAVAEEPFDRFCYFIGRAVEEGFDVEITDSRV